MLKLMYLFFFNLIYYHSFKKYYQLKPNDRTNGSGSGSSKKKPWFLLNGSGSGSGSYSISFCVEAEAAEKKFWKLEAEAEAIEKKFSVFKVEAEAMKNFSIKWKRKRKLWNFFSQNGSGSGSAIKIYRFQNAGRNSSIFRFFWAKNLYR